MFLKISKLAKMMKAANKAGTLRIGCDPETMGYRGYYISGSWWCVHLSIEGIHKDIKAEIVRYLGDMPEGGEEYQINNGMAQGCVYGALDMYLPKWEVNTRNGYYWTRYMITCTHDIRIYQDPDTQRMIGMDEDLLTLLDDSATTSCNLSRPRLSNRGTLIWSDDDTTLELYPMDISSTRFVEYMKYCDLLEMDETEPTAGRARFEEDEDPEDEEPEEEEPGENNGLNILPPAPDPE